MNPVHPTLNAFLARDRQEALLQEVAHHRLMRAARVAPEESRLQRCTRRIRLARPPFIRATGSQTTEAPAGKGEGINGRAAA
jgi:hypothetical protein